MSTETEESKDTLLDQKQALQTYLNSLLINNVASANVETLDFKQVPQELQNVQEIVKPISIEQRNIDFVRSLAGTTTGLPPKWAVNGFTGLRFSIGGINLIIPSKQVYGVCAMPSSLESSNLNPEWLKGCYKEKSKTIRVINMRKILFANLDNQAGSDDSDFQLILVGDGSWAICCEEIAEINKIQASDVIWRLTTSNRRWLVGASEKWSSIIVDAQRIAFSIAMERPLV